MNRHTHFLLVVALITILTGCSNEPQLSFMAGGAPNEIAYWESVTERFTEETGIPVRLIRQTTDTDQRKQSIIMALRGRRSDPDVMLVDVAWIGQLAASDWLYPLNDYDIDISPFFQSVISLANFYNDQLIGIPLYVDGGLLYYRKDLLERYGFSGPPQHWSELLDMAKKVQLNERNVNDNFWGFVWQGAQYEGLVCNVVEIFTSAGGGILDQDGNSKLMDPNNLEALEFMTSLIHTHKISPPNTFTDMKEEEVRMSFQAGNAMFQRNWPYAWGLHNAQGSGVRGNVGIAPLPSFQQNSSAATLGGWHAVISSYTDVPEKAVKFLKYITSYDVQRDMALNLGWNPGRTDIYDDPQIREAMPHLIELKPVFENAVPRPVVPYYAEISSVLQRYINAALAGLMSPQDALERADRAVSKIIKSYEQN
ncbi:Maltose/maltodextrin ABC transporter, substrate binding periplasmic protein MalE [Chitinispirillum alkaliphilum]|nr:Maltose/maltodextrin ABC transporter, substrate binding periplasmic protein MalE [Chitinispirillum alkaliphilum]